MINILIADDHEIVRVGTGLLVKEIFDSPHIDEAEDFNKALLLLDKKKYDLLILDVNIPGGNTFDMIGLARLRQKDVPILIFSSYDEQLYSLRFLEEGANGYISKDAATDMVKQAIKTVIEKRDYISTMVQEQLITIFKDKKGKQSTDLALLSNREIEIVRLLIKGIGTNEAGQILNLRKNTISTYKARIFKKLQVNNLIELADKIKII
jgi:two-component system invasion response regulator UvrY